MTKTLIVSAMRNEAPYVVDWLAHLKALGADRVLIYSNDCEDGTDALLDALEAAGEVVHQRHAPEPDVSIQWHAFRAAWKHPLRKECDWAMVCDVDEFPRIAVGGFSDLIAAMPEGADGMVLPWRLFGAVNGREIAAPVPDTSQRAMGAGLQYPIAATMFKTLVRLDGPFNQFGIHRPSQKKGAVPRWVDGSGRPMNRFFCSHAGRLSLFGMERGRELAEMYHYSLRSPEEFLIKRVRGLPNKRDRVLGLDYWVERNFASEARPMAVDQGERARIMALPGVAELHEAGVAWHRAAFERLVAEPEGEALWSRCVMSGASREVSDREAAQLYARFRKANGIE